MSESSALSEVESGVVDKYFEERGYGFINVGGQNQLFFYVAELLKAGRERLDTGTRVKFCRGQDKEGRPKVQKFLEFNGVPVGQGSYTVINRRFVPGKTADSFVRAVVKSFSDQSGYGFVVVGGKDVLIHFCTQGHGSTESFEPYRFRDANRPVPQEGDIVLLWVVPGKPDTGGKAYKWILESTAKQPLTATVEKVPQQRPPTVVASDPKQEPVKVLPAEKPAVKVVPNPVVLPAKPKIDETQWLDVVLRKIRREQTTYGDSDTLGQVKVPWSVLMQAKITGVRRDEVLRVRCKAGEDLPTAIEVKRS